VIGIVMDKLYHYFRRRQLPRQLAMLDNMSNYHGMSFTSSTQRAKSATPGDQAKCAACGRAICDHPDAIYAGFAPSMEKRGRSRPATLGPGDSPSAARSNYFPQENDE